MARKTKMRQVDAIANALLTESAFADMRPALAAEPELVAAAIINQRKRARKAKTKGKARKSSAKKSPAKKAKKAAPKKKAGKKKAAKKAGRKKK